MPARVVIAYLVACRAVQCRALRRVPTRHLGGGALCQSQLIRAGGLKPRTSINYACEIRWRFSRLISIMVCVDCSACLFGLGFPDGGIVFFSSYFVFSRASVFCLAPM